jgi:methionyl-tRNA formyltransferase
VTAASPGGRSGDRATPLEDEPSSAPRPALRRTRTVFLGSGAFATPILAALAEHSAIDLAAVITAPPRPTGRRAVLTPTPIHVAAGDLGVTVETPTRLRDPKSLDRILALEPALVVLADYGQLVPGVLLDGPHGALNLHPSLLPRHRGATPIPAAILAGDRETGVTLMRMDAGLDTGPIVSVERIPLRGDETTPELEPRLAELAAMLLARDLAAWLAGDLPARPQDESRATLTRPLRREDGRLDPSRPAEELERQVRAYQPWPGSFLDAEGDRLGVLRALVVPGRPGDEPGQLVREDRDLALVTAADRLLLREVHPAGGRPMTSEAFLRGRPSIVGRAVRA